MAENGTDVILDEISGDEIQSVLDTLMGNSSISFMDYVTSIIQGKVPFDPADMGRQLIQSVFGNIGQQKSMLLYVLLLAVIGAVITNFSKLMQGKQVATTAFYGVYLLLFSVLTGAFMQASTLAVQTLSGLLEFIKVLTPAYFISMSFASGAGAGAVYYEFTLVIVAVIDLVLVKILLPAINVFFLLAACQRTIRRGNVWQDGRAGERSGYIGAEDNVWDHDGDQCDSRLDRSGVSRTSKFYIDQGGGRDTGCGKHDQHSDKYGACCR